MRYFMGYMVDHGKPHLVSTWKWGMGFAILQNIQKQ